MSLFYSQEPTKNTQIREAIEFLRAKNLIYPESVIAGEIVEEALQQPFVKEWVFRTPWLQLREEITKLALFTTTRGLDEPSFRIVSSEEISKGGEMRLKRSRRSDLRTHYVLHNHDTSSLKEDDLKKHQHSARKAAAIVSAMEKALMDNKFF